MTPRLPTAVLALALSATISAIGVSQSPPPPEKEVGASQLAIVNLPAKGGAKLTVTSSAFSSGADIPFENTQYKGNVFPGLAWTAGPAGTKSYAIIMQDADILRAGAPILHWTMVNIPASVMKLDAGMTTPPNGSQYGPNIRGTNQAYLGPRTPAGPKHRYHIQIFALDATLPAESTADYASLTATMKDHVLASGELVGLGQVMPAPGSP